MAIKNPGATILTYVTRVRILVRILSLAISVGLLAALGVHRRLLCRERLGD